MSSFAGLDLFGSGGHRIIIGGWNVSKKRTGYAGVDGLESLILGGRGRKIVVTGQLGHTTASGLEGLIGAIENQIVLGTGDFIDNWGATYSNAEIDSINVNRPFDVVSNGDFIINHVTTLTQLRT